MPIGENHHRDMADAISRLFWDNFLKTEPALIMRDVIAIELDKARDTERERCAQVAEAHKGSATKKRRARGPQNDNSMLDEIYAEERGEDIAAEMIAREIRNLKD